jgi:putative transposase
VKVTRIHRLCRKEGFKVRRHPRKRRAIGTSSNACHVQPGRKIDDVWCWDFVFDRTENGTTLKWLSIINEYTRECLSLKVDRTITSEYAIDALAELFAMRGVPCCLRSDNGPEFIAQAIQQWFSKLDLEALFIAPGSPWQNGYAESFHSKLRDEFLDREIFEGLTQARRLTHAWQHDCNHQRPHSSLGYLTPTAFATRCREGGTFAPWRNCPTVTLITGGAEFGGRAGSAASESDSASTGCPSRPKEGGRSSSNP